VLGRRPGVERVEASPIVQTATLVLDPARSFLADLRRHLEEYGLHSAGQSVPHHICGPLMEPTRRKATVTMRLSTRTYHQPLGPSPPGHGAVPCRADMPTPGATPTCGWSPGCQEAASGPGW
jgi:Cu2+-exporting ATPase